MLWEYMVWGVILIKMRGPHCANLRDKGAGWGLNPMEENRRKVEAGLRIREKRIHRM
jgi:hypothetical protein